MCNNKKYLTIARYQNRNETATAQFRIKYYYFILPLGFKEYFLFVTIKLS